jgi:hypothetical protein
MPHRQGRRLFLVCLTLVLATPGFAESPEAPSAGKPETEKKREPLLEGLKSPRTLDRTKLEREPEIAVHHLARQESGWSVAATDHFRIHHIGAKADARKAAIAAEKARTTALRKWFGNASQEWSSACDVYIYPTAEDYSQGTGVPPHSPGHSEIRAEGSRVLLRRIYLHADVPGMVDAVLPHEVTHAVVAGHFGDSQVPRWADEGMAILDEPRERIDRHLRTLVRLRDQGLLYTARELLRLTEYPSPRRVPAFYAQSVSLTEFLSSAKDAKTVADFVRDGLHDGYEASLKRHYGWDFDELERRWRKHAFHE